MADTVRTEPADLDDGSRQRLARAHRRLRDAVASYDRVRSSESASVLRSAQHEVQAAEDDLWRLREELLGWSRPSWAPSATATADWFSAEDAVYDELPEENPAS